MKSFLNPVLAVVVAGALAPHTSLAETPSQLAVAALDTSGATDARPEPLRWLPSRGRECNERGKYKRFCAGPRRAPLPFGEEAALAAELGLGDKKTVSHLLLQAPKPEWIEAAGPVFNVDPIWPVPRGKFWRGFGRAKKKARHHDGVDIGAPVGTPIVSVQDGIVAYADNGIRGYGNFLVTVHGDGSVAFYAHCKSIYVFPGQIIAQGQIVAEVGTTGYARGPHLHFEMRNKGRLKDPMKLLTLEQPGNS
jgi:murein DD-endopeptidase MepM/ murein hydrolase activator NlpD